MQTWFLKRQRGRVTDFPAHFNRPMPMHWRWRWHRIYRRRSSCRGTLGRQWTGRQFSGWESFDISGMTLNSHFRNIWYSWTIFAGLVKKSQPKIQNSVLPGDCPFFRGFPQPPGGDTDRPREAPQNRTNNECTQGKWKKLLIIAAHFARRVRKNQWGKRGNPRTKPYYKQREGGAGG